MGVDPLLEKAIGLQRAGKFAEAQRTYRRFLDRADGATAPNDAHVLHQVGLCAQGLGRNAEAVEWIDRAIASQPDVADFHINRSLILTDLDRLGEAEAAARRAIALKPHPQAWYSLGRILRKGDRAPEAAEAFARAIALKPDHVKAHFTRGVLLLQSGDYANGWPEFEWRRRLAGFSSRPREYAQPRWDGSPAPGKTILLHPEQGYGDTIQFARYVPIVAERVGKVILESPASLASLLSRVPGVGEVIRVDQPPPPFDLHCPLMSLPRVLGTTLETIPNRMPCLVVDPEKSGRWEHALNALGDSIKIGLAWAGSARHVHDRERSIPVDRFAPLLQLPGVSVVNVQKEPNPQFGAAPPGMINWTNHLSTFDDSAALVSNLDLVVSVDSAVAHLAGALAKPVFTLLHDDPDWRWMLNTDTTPWYPTMRLFRQPRRGEWSAVIESVIEAVREMRDERSHR